MTKLTNAILITATVLAGLATSARFASAQDLEPPRARQGYYMGVGGDFILNNNWEDGEGTGLWKGGGFNLSIGQLITRRFGLEPHRWVNGKVGSQQRLRGICAKVVVPGTITAGDEIVKLPVTDEVLVSDTAGV